MRKRPKHADEEAEVDMTPMLDIVFIMLIFFIVTTSFTKESGVELSRPAPVPPDQPQPKEKTIPIIFVIDQNDIVTMDGREIDFRAVGANVEREKAKYPKSAVIVNVHPEASNEAMIKVVDAAREAGVKQVNVATTAVTTR
ncbi:MAG TPA: biopolymer transporter ExbD [Aeromonadales bacterium]|nr:biopolymer transporter ExbD [Aeromonadales bacterium]